MSKSILYATNSNVQNYVATGTTINFGNIIRRYGCNCNLSGGNAIVQGQGYYRIDTNINFTGAAGTATIQLFKDGAEIPGTRIVRTTAADTNFDVSIPCVIREVCCNESTITAVISGVAGTVINASILIEKE